MSGQPEQKKAPLTTAVSGAVGAAVVIIGGGSLQWGGFDWMVDPSAWWLWLITVVVVGLIYFQIRNNLS